MDMSDTRSSGRDIRVGLAFVSGLTVGAVGAILAVARLPSQLPDQWLWYVWAIVATSGLLYLIAATRDKAPGVASQPVAERDGIGLVCTFGAIGGLVRWLHTLFETPELAYGRTSFLGPLESSALALVVVLALRAGLISPTAGNDAKAVNWMGLYATAALTGLFTQEAIPKMTRVFVVIFGANPS